MTPLFRLLTLVVLFALSQSATAQRRLNLFVECECNKTLLKQRLNYVNHTIDPVGAQINLFIVTSYLSNGGRVYNLQFKGQQELAGNDLSFEVPTTAVMTGLERDELLTRRIELGLAGFLAGTDYGDVVEINSDKIADVAEEPTEADEETANDNWNAWIFEVFANFRFENESQRGRSEVRLGFEADRTTPELRVRFRPNFFYRTQSAVQADGTELTSIRKDMWLNASVVKSISDHFSVGVFTSASQSTFRNIDAGTWLAPAIEYNFFDYADVPFRELTVAYRVGWVYNNYTEETIFLETEESLARQVLDVDLRLRQRWGSIFTGISGGNFLNDFSKNRFVLRGRGNVRLFKGLSFNVSGSYEIINDQISLPRGEASVEDILLGQAQLATNFSADIRFGLSYTFGSLYNNVINTRL